VERLSQRASSTGLNYPRRGWPRCCLRWLHRLLLCPGARMLALQLDKPCIPLNYPRRGSRCGLLRRQSARVVRLELHERLHLRQVLAQQLVLLQHAQILLLLRRQRTGLRRLRHLLR